MATSTEKATPVIPGTEGMELEHETSLHRVSTYPIVKDSLDTAYSYVQANTYASAAYTRASDLSSAVLSKLLPIAQARLPIEKVDQYANAGLDLLEKNFPIVKEETKVVVKTVRSPADGAIAIAQGYKDGLTSRVTSGRVDISARIVRTQEILHHLTERLTAVVEAVPRDPKAAGEALANIYSEIDSQRAALTTYASELPSHAQAAAREAIEAAHEGAVFVKAEFARKDISLTAKTTNIVTYSKEKGLPLLASLRDVVIRKKVQVEETVEKNTEAVQQKSHLKTKTETDKTTTGDSVQGYTIE